jgi:hypothetical protein
MYNPARNIAGLIFELSPIKYLFGAKNEETYRLLP